MLTTSCADSPPLRRRDFALLFTIALAARWLNTWWLSTSPNLFYVEDSILYWERATALIEHQAFVLQGANGIIAETERMPLYPMLIAAVRLLVGDSITAVMAVLSLIDALTCVLIMAGASTLSPRIARLAGLLAALWPNLIIHSGQLLTDSTFLLFVTLSVLVFMALCVRSSWLLVATLSACLGLAILTRAAAQFAPLIVLPLAIWLGCKNQLKPARMVVVITAFVMPMALLLGPIMARNITQFDTLSLTSQGGTHMLLWVVPNVTRDALGIQAEHTIRRVDTTANDKIATQEAGGEPLNPFARDSIRFRVAKEELSKLGAWSIVYSWSLGAVRTLASPALLIDTRIRALSTKSLFATHGATWFNRIKQFLLGNSGAYQFWALIALLGSAIACVLQLLGGLLLWRRNPWMGLGAVAIIAYFVLLNGPIGNAKYRLPMEPVLTIFTAVAIEWAATRFSRWRRRSCVS